MGIITWNLHIMCQENLPLRTIGLKIALYFHWKIALFTNSLVLSCNASYVGETSRHLSVRINEHLSKDSHIYKHLSANQACKDMCSNDCFSILAKFNILIKNKGGYVYWLDETIIEQTSTLSKDLTFNISYHSLEVIFYH